MRKIVALALALIVAAGISVPASGEPHVRRREFAYANWMFPTEHKNEFRWLGALVWHTKAVPDGRRWFSFAGFIKGHCTRERSPGYILNYCEGHDVIRGHPNRDFQMSPLALDAELRIRHRGRVHVARWVGKPSPLALYLESESCYTVGKEGEAEKEGEGHGPAIWNRARATGRFYGHRFRRPGQVRSAGLATSVVASTCSFASVRYDRATGTFHVTTRVPR